jgi:hypothetical protein
VPAWHIDQIASTDEFYTAINHNGAYVASKYIIGERGRHDFLWRPEVDNGTTAHRQRIAFADSERTGDRVDEKVTELVFVDFSVRLVLFGHNSASGLLQLPSFERLVFVCGCGCQYRIVVIRSCVSIFEQ